jgi:raffinose/stachyose/melibiose transport system permease protein
MIMAARKTVSAWRVRRAATRAAMYAVLILLVMTTITPLVTLILASLKKDMELIKAGGFALPNSPQWQNYALAWSKGHMGVYFTNTVIVTFAVCVLGIALAVSCAYAIVTLHIPFRRFWTFLFMIGIVFPESSIIIPSYFNLRLVGLYDTYWALILPQTALSIAFGAFFLQPAFKDIPQELIDCSVLDGCGDFSSLFRILLPMLQPAIAVLVIFFFLGTWNDFLVASILVSKDELRTLPFALLSFLKRYTANAPLIAASTVISAIPAVVLYLIFFRKVVQGVATGALKE